MLQTIDQAQNYLTDDQHGETKHIHAPLWLEILDRCKEPASSTIVGLGDLVVSPLIELSQWGFPITCVTDVYKRMLRVQQDIGVQAGEFEKMYYMNYFLDCPKGRIVTFIGIVEHLSNGQIFVWLDLLLRRCREVIFPVPVGRDWYRLLASRYDTVIRRYPSGSHELIILRNKYEEQSITKKPRREMEKRGQDSPTNSQTALLSKKQREDRGREKQSQPTLNHAH